MSDASLICVMHPSYVWCVIDMCHASLICVMPSSDGLCGSSWREGIAELLLCMMMRHWYGRVAAVRDVSLIWPSWWDAVRAASRALFGAPLVTKGTYSRKRAFDTQKRPIYTQKRPKFAHDAVCLESAWIMHTMHHAPCEFVMCFPCFSCLLRVRGTLFCFDWCLAICNISPTRPMNMCWRSLL